MSTSSPAADAAVYTIPHDATRPWLVFDMDEVLVNSRSNMVAALHAVTGKYYPWEEWGSYQHTTMYNLSLDTVLDVFYSYRVLEECHVEPGVVEALTLAKSAGYNTGVITARGWHPDGLLMTKQTFETAGVPIDKILVVGLLADKADYISHFGSIQAYVDDNADHVRALQQKGVPSYLQDRPWNRHHALPRVRHIEEIVRTAVHSVVDGSLPTINTK